MKEELAVQGVLEGWVEEGTEITDLLVPAEFNHELFPLASTALDPEEKLLTFTIKTPLPDGRVMERTLEVEGSPRLGLPGLFDQEVYAGVMALAEQKGGIRAGDGRVRFSLYELKEILRLPTNAVYYRMLRDSLLRWQRTSLTTKGAIYLADTEEYAQGQAYNIWSVQWARESGPGRAKTDLNEVRFHEYFIRNYTAGYIKSIDWDFWLSLGRGKRGGTLKRLYRLIDAERAGTLEWRTTVQRLMGQLPIPPSYKYPNKARRFLSRYHADLVDRGFLEVAEVSNDYEVFYRVNARFVNRQRQLALAEDPRDRGAIELLISFGVREKAAQYLVALRGPELCERYAGALPYQRDVRRKAGWLKTYIEGDRNGPYAPKDGFAPLRSSQITLQRSNSAETSPEPPEEGANSDVVLVVTGSHQERHLELGEGHPEVSTVEDVRRRHEAGEFDAAIEAFETAPFKQYAKYVGTAIPVHADDTDNRYYVSLDGVLYLCLDRSTDEDHLLPICPLNRKRQ